MKTIVRLLAGVLVAALVLVAAAWLTLGGGTMIPDRSTTPTMRFDIVEKVADLDFPPGNIAVSADGRVFFTLHPDGHPPRQVVELVGGKPVAFPNEEFQHEHDGIPYFQSILAVRIDRQGRLWVLDFARFGRGTPRIVAFDIRTRELV